MSEENVEIAKRLIDAGNRGDIEAVLELVADDVVWTRFEIPLGVPRTARGREEVMRFNAEWAELFDGWTREVEEWIDAGDWVIAVGTWGGTGKETGAYVEGRRDSSAIRFHEGKVVEWITGFPDKEVALEAAGLRE